MPKKTTARKPTDPFAPTAAQVRALTDKLLALSANAGLAGPKPVKKAPALSVKAAKVVDLLNTQDFGCYTSKVTSLMEVLLDEKLSDHISAQDADADCVEHSVGVCVVLTTHAADHNYPIGQVLMHVDDSDNGLITSSSNFDGEGNCISDYLSDMRMPTKDEVTEFVKARFFTIVKILKDADAL